MSFRPLDDVEGSMSVMPSPTHRSENATSKEESEVSSTHNAISSSPSRSRDADDTSLNDPTITSESEDPGRSNEFQSELLRKLLGDLSAHIGGSADRRTLDLISSIQKQVSQPRARQISASGASAFS